MTRTKTLSQELNLKAVDQVIDMVKGLQQKSQEGKDADAKLNVLMSLFGSNGNGHVKLTGNFKGRAPGAKDVKRRFRRTKEEMIMGLSLNEAKKLRRKAS